MPKNIWGEEVGERPELDPWFVTEERRLAKDDPEDPKANAIDDETGDDLDGWQPGDPV